MIVYFPFASRKLTLILCVQNVNVNWAVEELASETVDAHNGENEPDHEDNNGYVENASHGFQQGDNDHFECHIVRDHTQWS